MSALAPRFTVVLDALDVAAGQRVLELGPGHGVLATALLERVGRGGSVHLLDRSQKMLDAATARNHGAVADGRLTVTTARLQEATLPGASFDRVVAVRVRELWSDGEVALPRVRAWLVPGGRLVVGLDAPDGAVPTEVVGRLTAQLAQHGFADVDVTTGPDATAVSAVAA